MNLDIQGRRAAAALFDHVSADVDAERALERLYRLHVAKQRTRRRRPPALAVAFAIVAVLVAVLAVVGLWSAESSPRPATPVTQPTKSIPRPAPSTTTTSPATTTTRAASAVRCISPCISVTVVDAAGRPFPLGQARAMACPVSGAACVVGDTDASGIAHLQLVDGVEYKTNGAVVNVDWCNPSYTSSNGDRWWFSEELAQGLPTAAADAQFTVVQPQC